MADVCEELVRLDEAAILEQLRASLKPGAAKCRECGAAPADDLWFNLHSFAVACGRRTQRHMEKLYHTNRSHPLCINLATGMLWNYDGDVEVLNNEDADLAAAPSDGLPADKFQRAGEKDAFVRRLREMIQLPEKAPARGGPRRAEGKDSDESDDGTRSRRARTDRGRPAAPPGGEGSAASGGGVSGARAGPAAERSGRRVTWTEYPLSLEEGQADPTYDQAAAAGLAGLQNLGNTCFLNAALQALSCTPYWSRRMVEVPFAAARGAGDAENPTLAFAMFDFLTTAWEGRLDVLSPRLVLSTLRRVNRMFLGYNQHDSQEALRFLLSDIHDRLAVDVPLPVGSLSRGMADPFGGDEDGPAGSLPAGAAGPGVPTPWASEGNALGVVLPSGAPSASSAAPASSVPSSSPSSSSSSSSSSSTPGSGPGASTPGPGEALLSRKPSGSASHGVSITVEDTGVSASGGGGGRSGGSTGLSSASSASSASSGVSVPLLTRRVLSESKEWLHEGPYVHRPSMKRSPVSDVFQGVLCSRVRCRTCAYESATFDTFFDLSLPIPDGPHAWADGSGRLSAGATPLDRSKRDGFGGHRSGRSWLSSVFCSLGNLFGRGVNVQDCLYEFCDSDELVGDDQWYCDRCRARRDADKTMAIAQLPEVLCLHLKRFTTHGGWAAKNTTHVDFPVDEPLNLEPFVFRDATATAQRIHAAKTEREDRAAAAAQAEAIRIIAARTATLAGTAPTPTPGGGGARSASGAAAAEEPNGVTATAPSTELPPRPRGVAPPVLSDTPLSDAIAEQLVAARHQQRLLANAALPMVRDDEGGPGQGPFVYDLVSIVRHIGIMGGGHYIAYGKRRNTDTWYCFDDQSVDEVTRGNVRRQEAYLLFFARRPSPAFARVPALPPASAESKILAALGSAGGGGGGGASLGSSGLVTGSAGSGSAGSGSAGSGSASAFAGTRDPRIFAFVSRSWWLRRSVCACPGPVSSLEVQCPHGRLKRDLTGRDVAYRHVVPLTREQWGFLVRQYGRCGKPLLTLDPCAECEAEAELLRRRRERELDQIRAVDTIVIDKEAGEEDSCWYIMSARWLNEWNEFVRDSPADKAGGGSSAGGPSGAIPFHEDGTGRGRLPPGPVDNSFLLRADGRPRPNLQPVTHYRGVNGKVWRFFLSLYGGGPTLRRAELDLYAAPLDPVPAELLGTPVDASESTGGPERDPLSPSAAAASGRAAAPSSSSSSSSSSSASSPYPTAGAPPLSAAAPRSPSPGMLVVTHAPHAPAIGGSGGSGGGGGSDRAVPGSSSGPTSRSRRGGYPPSPSSRGGASSGGGGGRVAAGDAPSFSTTTGPANAGNVRVRGPPEARSRAP